VKADQPLPIRHNQFWSNFAVNIGFNLPNNPGGYLIMVKKIILVVSAVLAFGSALRSNAGTEVIEPYSAPAPTYSYAPPPRPIYYAPPPPVNVLIFPAYGYYGPRFGVHRYYARRAFVRPYCGWR
jgi:hypothetical protein